MKKEWVLPLRDQCRRNGVPFFFKQWGGVRKAAAGRRLEGRTYDEFPKRSRHPVMSVEECASKAREIEGLCSNSTIIPLASLQSQSREEVCC
jgi:hypothetical protein